MAWPFRYFGRNGWCDGLDVKPLIWDVTADIVSPQPQPQPQPQPHRAAVGSNPTPAPAPSAGAGVGAGKGVGKGVVGGRGHEEMIGGGDNTLTYYALSYPVGNASSPSQQGCGGNIVMSSFLVYY